MGTGQERDREPSTRKGDRGEEVQIKEGKNAKQSNSRKRRIM